MSLHAYDPRDRRSRRSERLQLAVHYQLVHAVESFDLDLITVSDADGHLLASSTQPTASLGTLLSEVVAAFSPLIASGDHQERPSERLLEELEQLGLEWSAEDLTVCAFQAGGQRMIITALGGSEYLRDIGVYRVIFGIRRIWEQTTAVHAS